MAICAVCASGSTPDGSGRAGGDSLVRACRITLRSVMVTAPPEHQPRTGFPASGEDAVMGRRQVLAGETRGQWSVPAFDGSEDVVVLGLETSGPADRLQMYVDVAIGLSPQLLDELDRAGPVGPPVNGGVELRVGRQPCSGIVGVRHDCQLLAHEQNVGAAHIREARAGSPSARSPRAGRTAPAAPRPTSASLPRWRSPAVRQGLRRPGSTAHRAPVCG